MTTVTIRDVAERAGVGIGTVSRVLNNNPSVRHSTRQRVLSAIEELNYSPNPTARRLSLGKTHTLGAIVPTFTRPSFVERLRGALMTIGSSDYDLILFSVESPEQRNHHIQQMATGDRIDGLIILSIRLTDEEANQFAASGPATVLIDSYHPLLNCVHIDDIAGGRQACQHLIDLGHRRIAFLGDQFNDKLGNGSMPNRYEGYRQSLENAGILHPPAYIKLGQHGREAARQLTQELLSLAQPPTAIVAASDTHAIGALQAAADFNLSVPEQLSIIGYDDIEAAEYLNLTTIRQMLLQSGQIGAQLLLDIISSPPQPAKHIGLPTELILRGTTATPN